MDCYIYAADCYCEKCGESIRAGIDRAGIAPNDLDDETTFDCGVYPKGPFADAGGEADTPQHCGSGEDCLDPTVIAGEKYGRFLENDLTHAGVEYVRELHADRPTPVTEFWAGWYNSHGYSI